MEAKFQIFLDSAGGPGGHCLLARRINVAPAILLLLAGVVLCLRAGNAAVEALPPELVLLVVLPPLIYSASVAMSWREFKRHLRPIILLSVGCVKVFTACGGRRRNRLPDRAAVERRVSAWRRCRAAGRGGAAGHRPQALPAPAHPGGPRRRGPGERRYRADPVSLRGGGDIDRRIFVAQSRRHLRRHCRRRGTLRCRGRLAQSADTPLRP